MCVTSSLPSVECCCLSKESGRIQCGGWYLTNCELERKKRYTHAHIYNVYVKIMSVGSCLSYIPGVGCDVRGVLINPRVVARTRVIVVGLCVCVCVCVCVYVFLCVCKQVILPTVGIIWIPHVDMWVSTMSAWHSKSLERCCWRKANVRVANVP